MSHFLFLETSLRFGWLISEIRRPGLTSQFSKHHFIKAGWIRSFSVYQFFDQEQQSLLQLRVCGYLKAKGCSIMVPIIEQSCRHSTESHPMLTCQMSTLASDAPFMQTMTLCPSAGYQAEWIVKLRCHIDNLFPDLTAASHPLIALLVL